MPITIAYEYPRRSQLRRLGTRVVSLIGLVLILFGLVAWIPLLLFAIGSTYALVADGEMPNLSESAGLLAVSILLALVFTYLGIRLMKGKRRLVLFLRRFGFVDATEALTFAVATAIGSSRRLVTLDDARIAPVGVRHRTRWVIIIAATAVITLVTWLVYWVFGGGLESTLDNAVSDFTQDLDFFEAIVGIFLVVIVFGLILLTITLIPAAFLGAGAVFLFATYRSVRAAEGAKVRMVSSEGEINGIVGSLVAWSRRIFAPRLVIVRVANEIWQLVVRRIASESSAVIVDISEPTENLLWEITNLKPELGERCILIGEESRLKAMNSADRSGTSDEYVSNLMNQIDGETILAYSGDLRARKRFSKALRARLETL